jgi:hypothetical protein
MGYLHCAAIVNTALYGIYKQIQYNLRFVQASRLRLWLAQGHMKFVDTKATQREKESEAGQAMAVTKEGESE